MIRLIIGGGVLVAGWCAVAAVFGNALGRAIRRQDDQLQREINQYADHRRRIDGAR